MEVALIASFNPPYKYLRIRSLGAGFNPANGGELQWNGSYDRGFFQGDILIHMHPLGDLLTTLSTDPKNINRQTQYTTGSQFSVGVDISKNPSFNSSYTISESTTTEISDFNIYNDSAGLNGDWNFVMGMIDDGGKVPPTDSVFNIFSEQFWKKAQVKKLPALATKNLQAVTEAVWFADNTVNASIGIQLYWKVYHYHCWVEGDWVKYTMYWYYTARTVSYASTPLYIDFSSVNA